MDLISAGSALVLGKTTIAPQVVITTVIDTQKIQKHRKRRKAPNQNFSGIFSSLKGIIIMRDQKG